jgi:hypothetical protein
MGDTAFGKSGTNAEIGTIRDFPHLPHSIRADQAKMIESNAPMEERKEMNRLEVKASKLPLILAILLGLFFVPLGLVSVITGLLKGFEVVPLGIGFMMLIVFGVIIWLIRRGHFRSVKYFSDEGLARNDGRSFAWADLSRVVDQIRVRPSGRKTIWRTEIQFKNGESAWLIPPKVNNYPEVSEFVRSLPCEHTEVRA